MKFVSKIHKYLYIILTALLIGTFFGLSYYSSHGLKVGKIINVAPESITYDEIAHIGASYQYWHDKKIILNAEHPALTKIIVGLPISQMKLNSPGVSNADLLNGHEGIQWLYGRNLILFNNPTKTHQIINRARLTMLLANTLLLIMAIALTFKLFSKKTSLLLLALLALNPVFIGHATLVTFDVPALLTTILVLLGMVGFVKYRTYKWSILAGGLMGLALVTKYSAIAVFIYATIYMFGLAIYDFVKKTNNLNKNLLNISYFYLATLMVIIIIYLPFVINLSSADQLTLMSKNWTGHLSRYPNDLLSFLTKLSLITKALAVWLNGLFITKLEVVSGRSGTFFMSHVYSSGYILPYFPTLILTKTPIGTLLIIAISFWHFGTDVIKRESKKYLKFAALPLIYGLVYLAYGMDSRLKLGVRHMFPVIGSLILFSAIVVSNNWSKLVLKIKTSTLVLVFVALILIATLLSFPHEISYYNEITGGTYNSYNIAGDSNYDWGQDYLALHNWKVANPDKKLYLDVFAADGVTDYYFGNSPDIYTKWNNNKLPKGSYIAVDTNILSNREASLNINYKNYFTKPPFRLTPAIFIFEK